MSDYFENKIKPASEKDRGNIPYEKTFERTGIKTIPNQNNDPDRGIGAVDNAVRKEASTDENANKLV
jgi:hypothetical protein